MTTLRTAMDTDLTACWELRTRALHAGCAAHYPEPLLDALCASSPPASMSGRLAAGGAVVAEEDGKIVGYMLLDSASGEVEAAFVEPAYQGRGIALQLMQHIEALAQQRELSTLFLSASLNAVAFYERAGFIRVREEMYQHHSGLAVPSVYMEKPLQAARDDRL